MSKYMPGIPYLQMKDFNPDMSLKPYVNNGRPVVCMAQGVFCGYCTQAKPAFMDFAKQVGNNVVACTIQIDGDKELGSKISQLDPSYRGVPTYLLFNSSGKYVRTHDKGRDTQSLLAAAKSLS